MKLEEWIKTMDINCVTSTSQYHHHHHQHQSKGISLCSFYLYINEYKAYVSIHPFHRLSIISLKDNNVREKQSWHGWDSYKIELLNNDHEMSRKLCQLFSIFFLSLTWTKSRTSIEFPWNKIHLLRGLNKAI